MDMFLNILIPLMLILAIAGLAQPNLFVFWSQRKTRLQGFTVYFTGLLVALTLPGYTTQGSFAAGLIMSGIVICAPLFIASMIRPDDFVFWSARRTRTKAAFVYLGGLVALISLQTIVGENGSDSPFVWLFTPSVISLVALAGALFSPADVTLGEQPLSRTKAVMIYLPLAAICVGGTFYLGSRTPVELTVERHDFKTDFAPDSAEARLIDRLDGLEAQNDFPGMLREVRQLSTIYEYQAALGWLKNRTFSDIREPRWALLYALAAYNYKDADKVRALADTAAQLQVVGMTILRLDAARCVDEPAAMGKMRVWAQLNDELLENIKSRSRWERGNMVDAALNIEDTVADRPAARWICNDNPGNILSDAQWASHRALIRSRIDDGLLFQD